MTEHGQPCFLVKTIHELTQSDLNKPFSLNMDKHILRWKTKHWRRANKIVGSEQLLLQAEL